MDRCPLLLSVVFSFGLAACADQAQLPPSASIGANPTLPPPTVVIPTVDIAPAAGWPAGVKPASPEARASTVCDRARSSALVLRTAPRGRARRGDEAPERPGDGNGITGRVMEMVMKRAGAGVPSANRITL